MSLPADSTAPTHLPSGIFEWARLNVIPTKVGERRDLFDARTVSLKQLECHVTTVNVGEASHPPHAHPDEEIIIVKAGTLEITINGRVERAGPGSLVFYSSNDLHGMRNGGDVPATYYVLRWTSSETPAPSTDL